MAVKRQALLFAKGFCMGTADVIPGVSGGTMAFILGIYTELVDAIKSFDIAWARSIFRLDIKSVITKPHFSFLIPLGIGIVAALLFFTRVVHLPQLLVDRPEEIYGFFFGLISGSIVVLLSELKRLDKRDVIILIAGIVPAFMIFNLVPVQTPEAGWFVFISGALAICAMILPGISGSFILLILNKYAYIFNAIGYMKFSVLIPFALGAIAGLLVFSRILSYLLHKYYRGMLLFITGILFSSLTVIWPFQERIYENIQGKLQLIDSVMIIPAVFSQTVLISIFLIITGIIIVLLINRIGVVKRNEQNNI